MASVVSGPFCGPVIPVLAGSAKYDAATHALSLPIAIANQWSREVTGPMELYAWNDSISIAAPAGLINGEGGRYLSVEPPPDGGWSDDATIHSGVRWSYDRIVDTVPGSAMLPPGAQTPSRTLLIRLSAGGATAFTVRLRVEMRNAHAVQWGSPERLPAWVSADSALERGQFSKHVLAVTFRNGTSYQAMQAAVDSVRGTVIGGDHLSGYYVKVPSDGSWEGVDRVAKRLKALPQVLFAIVYIANLTIGPN